MRGSTVAAALLFALLVNGAILVLAASVVPQTRIYLRGGSGQAHQLMAPLLGAPAAATLFAVALIACGLAPPSPRRWPDRW